MPASVPCAEAATPARAVSPGDFPQRDPVAFRRVYADRWAEFIRSNFANPTRVAQAFGVDRRTATD
jgi:hypothetical protein